MKNKRKSKRNTLPYFHVTIMGQTCLLLLLLLLINVDLNWMAPLSSVLNQNNILFNYYNTYLYKLGQSNGYNKHTPKYSMSEAYQKFVSCAHKSIRWVNSRADLPCKMESQFQAVEKGHKQGITNMRSLISFPSESVACFAFAPLPPGGTQSHGTPIHRKARQTCQCGQKDD